MKSHRKILRELKWKGYTLRPRQEKLLPTLLRADHFMLLWQMRMGKTLPSAIAVAARCDRPLIIAPPKVVPVWHEHMKLIEYQDHTIVSSGILSPKEKEENGKIVKIPNPKLSALLKKKFDGVVIDEIHQFRKDSARTNVVRKLVKGLDFRLGLTGTPFDRDLNEIFYPWMILDDGDLLGTSKKKFHQAYCMKEDPYNKFSPWVFQPGMKQILETALSPNVDRHFPDSIKSPKVNLHRFTLTREQSEYIRDLREGNEIEFFQGDDIEFNAGVIREKVFQVCSGFMIHTIYYDERDEKGERIVKRGITTKKWTKLRRLVHRLEGRGVVWVRYIEEYQCVLDTLSKYRIKKYSASNLEALNKNKLDILVAHPRSAGVGVDISCADWAIFVSETPSNIDQSQARMRLSRVDGLEEKNLHYLLPEEEYNEEQHIDIANKRMGLEKFLKGGED